MTLERFACRVVERRLEDHVRGALDPAEEERIARHLMGCPDCAAQAGLAERVALELRQLPLFDAPPELIARIKATARRQRTPAASAARWPARRLRRAAALAAALLVALGAGWWHRAQRSDEPSPAQIARAEQEVRYALTLVARLGRKAGHELRQEILIERVARPVLQGVGRAMGRDESPKIAASNDGGRKS